MIANHRSSILLAVIAVAAALLSIGCTARPQAFKLSFLPSTPAVAEPTFEEPPHLAANFYSSESPDLVQRALSLAPRQEIVDSLIAKARSDMEGGRRSYQHGDMDAARAQFDSAMNVLLTAPANLPDRQHLEQELDQITDTIYRYDVEWLGAGASDSTEVSYDQSPLDGILDLTFPTDPNLRPKVKEEIEATVSQLPLTENDAVLSYIHYFSTERGRKVLINGMRRSGRYRPLVQRILDDEGIPQELIYLAQIESGFLPRARSYKQAVGMWQFVQFRGREYGLMQGPGTDDRLDPEKATRAAARHLHDLYAMFGDWYLAMAAYNCGPGCVQRAVERTGYADFWELRRLNALPKETANYVPLILAVVIMSKNPKDYDLDNLEMDQPVEYQTLQLDAPTSLALVADAADRPISEIQDLNPALLKAIAPAGYQLRVPKGTLTTIMSALDMVPADHRAEWRLHRVIAGETMAEIARHYATSLASLTSANSELSSDTPQSGDLVLVPVAARLSHHSTQGPVTARHHRSSHHAVTYRRASVTKPAHHRKAATYRTASLAVRRHTAAN